MPKLAEHVEATLDSGKRVSLTAIMVTTDFSEVSDRALDYAVALARRYDASIYLTHVITADPFQSSRERTAGAKSRKSSWAPSRRRFSAKRMRRF